MSRPRVERGSSALKMQVSSTGADVGRALRDLVVLSLRGWLDAIIWSLPRQTQRKTKKKDVQVKTLCPAPESNGVSQPKDDKDSEPKPVGVHPALRDFPS
jgi:hypothetical protein